MKVLLIAADYPPPFVGGSIVYVHSLLTGFPEPMEVLTGPLPPGETEPTPARHRALRSPWLVSSRAPSRLALAGMYAYLTVWLLVRKLRVRDDAVILSLGALGNALLIPVCRLIRVRAIPIAYAEELTMPLKGAGFKNALKRVLLKVFYRYAHGYVAVSQFTKDVLQSLGADPGRVKIIWPPFNAGKIKISEEARPPGHTILSVGRLVRRKGFDTLIRTVDRLREKLPDIRLCIVGDGGERSALESLVADMKLQKNVFLKGEASDEELAALYRQCDVFVLANIVMENGDCEGSPTVLIEASAYSKPVIAGDGTGADAMVSHGKTGYLVDANNLDALAGPLETLLRDPELSSKLGKAGRHKAMTNHTTERAGNRLHSLLTELLHTNNSLT
jgi:phosphatidylinositol alpha-1,6-mannosyltransferase